MLYPVQNSEQDVQQPQDEEVQQPQSNVRPNQNSGQKNRGGNAEQ
jgi:hypothetical protein